MKRLSIYFVLIGILSLFLVSDSFAQPEKKKKGGEGWGMENQYGRMYNTKTIETISGEVVSVDKITPVKGMSKGVHLMVKQKKKPFLSI